jgi:hypothetical protein
MWTQCRGRSFWGSLPLLFPWLWSKLLSALESLGWS